MRKQAIDFHARNFNHYWNIPPALDGIRSLFAFSVEIPSIFPYILLGIYLINIKPFGGTIGQNITVSVSVLFW